MAKINNKGLTDFEQTFLNFYFKNGFNGVEAFQLANPNSKYDSARTQSCKLLAKVHIVQEITKRHYLIREAEKIERSKQIARLNDLIYACIEDGDRNHLIKALDQLNKIGGLYQTRLDITSKNDKIIINLGLDDEDETQ